MKKPTKREQVNLLFSAFLVLGFGVCAYFFSAITGSSLSNSMVGKLIYMAVFVLFGLILFYATRVGEGRQVKRFSIFSLVLICLPALYVVCAYILDFLPLHEQLTASSASAAAIIAAVALGYGLPYSFLSGYEIDDSPEAVKTEKNESDDEPVDYSELKTLDIEVDSSDEDDSEADEAELNEAETADSAEAEPGETEQSDKAESEKPEADSDLSEDTERTIQSVLEEKSNK